jgi:hypothetical protein
MGEVAMALPSAARQKTARETLKTLFAYPATVYAVHYACQSLKAQGPLASARVGAIAVRQLSTGQVTPFSIADVAERNRLAVSDIAPNLDLIEQRVLEGFFEFVRMNRQARFIHWNMRDNQFGFGALEHRLIVLGGTPDTVLETNRFDLARLMEDLYGADYATGRGKMEAIARLNGMVSSGYLNGAQEAAALEAGAYRDVANSTQAKVRIISDVAEAAHDRTLKTEAGLLTQHAGPLRLMLQKMAENPAYTLVSGAIGGFVVMMKIWDYVTGS